MRLMVLPYHSSRPDGVRPFLRSILASLRKPESKRHDTYTYSHQKFELCSRSGVLFMGVQAMFSKLGLVPFSGLLILPAFSIEDGKVERGLPAQTLLLSVDGEIGTWPAIPTPHPNLRFAAIALKQQASGPTCGFYEYNNEPFDCYSNQKCFTSGRYFGCTAGSGSVPYTTCLDGSNPNCSKTNPGVGTLCCTSSTEYPFCVTALKSVTNGGSATITGFRCGNNRAKGTKVVIERKGPSTLSTTSAAPFTLPRTTTTTPPTSTLDPIPASSSSAATSAPKSSLPSSTTVGAIVGGVVGSLAVVGLSIAAVVWLLVRKRNLKAINDQGNVGHPPNTYMGQTNTSSAAMLNPGEGAQWHPQAPSSYDDAYKGHYHTTISVNDLTGSQHPYYASTAPSVSPATESMHQQQCSTLSYGTPGPMPMTPDDYAIQRPVSELPAINPPGIGNNASELPA